MSDVSDNKISEDSNNYCMTWTEKVLMNKIENAMKLEFFTMKSSRWCSSNTNQFRKDWSIDQFTENEYELKEISRDSDMKINLNLLQLHQKVKKIVWQKTERDAVWMMMNSTSSMMRFWKSRAQSWSDESQNDFNWWDRMISQYKIDESDIKNEKKMKT